MAERKHEGEEDREKEKERGEEREIRREKMRREMKRDGEMGKDEDPTLPTSSLATWWVYVAAAMMKARTERATGRRGEKMATAAPSSTILTMEIAKSIARRVKCKVLPRACEETGVRRDVGACLSCAASFAHNGIPRGCSIWAMQCGCVEVEGRRGKGRRKGRQQHIQCEGAVDHAVVMSMTGLEWLVHPIFDMKILNVLDPSSSTAL
jgi:hypothetical protein